MRNKRFIFVMAGALIFGLLAAFSVSRYLSSAQANTTGTKVAVAKVDIPVGTKIILEQIDEVEFPSNSIPSGAFESAQKLVGRVAVVQIAAREAVTDSKLAPEGTAGGLTAIIPEGYRAMTVKVDDASGVSGFLQPGAIVDVVVVIDPKENSINQDPISKVVLQNVRVLANAQNLDKPKDDREATTVKAVTLQVTPEQAEKLALASSEGKLQLVMRNSVDQADEQTSGANKKTLLLGERAMLTPEPGITSNPSAPKAAPSSPRRISPRPAVKETNVTPKVTTPPPAPRPTIEVIKGAKKETVDFP